MHLPPLSSMGSIFPSDATLPFQSAAPFASSPTAHAGSFFDQDMSLLSRPLRRTPSLRQMSSDLPSLTEPFQRRDPRQIQGFRGASVRQDDHSDPGQIRVTGLASAQPRPSSGSAAPINPLQLPTRRPSGMTSLPSLRDVLAAPEPSGLPPVNLPPSTLPPLSRAQRPINSRESSVAQSAAAPAPAPTPQTGMSIEEMQQAEGIIFESGPPYACEFW